MARKTKTENTPTTNFPKLLNAKHMQEMGLSRSMSYQLLNREDLPVVHIGERKFMNRDLFYTWLDLQAGGAAMVGAGVAAAL